MKKNTLEINATSSHSYWNAVNNSTASELQQYFQNTKSTGFYNAFQKEECWFDIGAGIISVIGNNDSWLYKNEKRCEKLSNKIYNLLNNKGGVLFIHIGDYTYKFN